MSKTLDDLSLAIVDCEHKTAPEGDGFAVSVGTRAMKDGRLVLNACKLVSSSTYDQWTRRLTPVEGDLVLAREAPVGQVVRVPAHPPICLGQRTVLIRPDAAKVDPRFLHYWLIGPVAQEFMSSRAGGATVAHLNVEDIRGLDVSGLPVDRKTQRFAAGLLGSIDDLIENNRRRIGLLEQMAQAIYREWFVKFRYPGHEHATFVDSPLGPIPSDWSASSVGEITSSVVRGVAPRYSEDGEWLALNQRCIRNGRVSLENARRQEKSVPPRKQVAAGDVLINSTGVGTLGRVAVAWESTGAVTADSHVTIVKPTSAALQPWIGLMMLERQAELEALGIGSTPN
jgi:type I restriction enzyme, S subunit